jgi:hypothetical protein
MISLYIFYFYLILFQIKIIKYNNYFFKNYEYQKLKIIILSIKKTKLEMVFYNSMKIMIQKMI